MQNIKIQLSKQPQHDSIWKGRNETTVAVSKKRAPFPINLAALATTDTCYKYDNYYANI